MCALPIWELWSRPAHRQIFGHCSPKKSKSGERWLSFPAPSRANPASPVRVRLGPADYRPAPLLRGRCSLVSGRIPDQAGSGSLGPQAVIIATQQFSRRCDAKIALQIATTPAQCTVHTLSARVRADVPLRPFWAIAQTDALGQELRAQPVGSTPILASTSLLARFDQ